MDPQSMEIAMLKNILEKTGKPLKEWIGIIKKQKLTENKAIVQFLKNEYSIGHFYAHLIAKKSI